MGQRSAFSTIAAVVTAFLQQRRWGRASLSEHVGVNARTLTRALTALADSGMPLTREGSGTDLAWSVSARWFPRGTLLTQTQLDALGRLLRRTPPCPARSTLLTALDADPAHAAVEPSAVSANELRALEVLEDSALSRRPVRARYHSLTRGEVSVLELSTARIFLGPPSRFLAINHLTDRLEWFRVSGVLDAQLLDTVAHRAAYPADLALFTGPPASPTDDRADAELCVLRIPLHLAPSVLRALPFDAEVLVHEDAAELRTRVADLRPVLRFVLAWGGVVEPVSPALRTALHEAASQLLVSSGAPSASFTGAAERGAPFAPAFAKETP